MLLSKCVAAVISYRDPCIWWWQYHSLKYFSVLFGQSHFQFASRQHVDIILTVFLSFGFVLVVIVHHFYAANLRWWAMYFLNSSVQMTRLIFVITFLIQKRVSSERCAELTIVAASHGLKEVWISNQVCALLLAIHLCKMCI